MNIHQEIQLGTLAEGGGQLPRPNCRSGLRLVDHECPSLPFPLQLPLPLSLSLCLSLSLQRSDPGLKHTFSKWPEVSRVLYSCLHELTVFMARRWAC